jgi:tartrate dehydrogenase/decarboxylase/D-malate dehydrogenase
VANPIATFWTGAMMLEHLGGRRRPSLAKAIEKMTGAGGAGLGGNAKTRTTRAVIEAL